MKNMAAINAPKPVTAETFIVDHVASEGRALAVTTTFAATSLDKTRTLETLGELISKSLSPYQDKIPDVSDGADYLSTLHASAIYVLSLRFMNTCARIKSAKMSTTVNTSLS